MIIYVEYVGVILGMKAPSWVTSRRLTRRRAGILASLLIACASSPPLAHGGYVESYQTWSATTADTWEVQNLSEAPFSVPADAVVEIAITNTRRNRERWGGVRAVGSILQRRFLLHEAEGGGWDVVVLHVQVDSSSEIEHYSDNTREIQFTLLGYWNCGTYVEAFQSFKAGASRSWQDHNLSTYGVSANEVAEVVLVNNNAFQEREAGVRTNGSSLSRIVDIHEAEAGGDDMATVFVVADGTADAAIEVYAENNRDVDFYLVGYWRIPPGCYTELARNIGGPLTSGTWQDRDLAGFSVPANAVVEFALLNRYRWGENNMGVRGNGSSLARVLDLQESEGGGSDIGRMHVTADVNSTIELYHEDVREAHGFLLAGYWTIFTYSVTDLATLTGDPSFGLAVNSSQQIAGYDKDSGTGEQSAWLWENGILTGLGTLGGATSAALNVGDTGTVIGRADTGSGSKHAFIWDNVGGMTDLGTLAGRSDSEAFAINTNSEVVGTSLNFGPPPTDRLAFLDLPLAAYGFPPGMNSLGTLGGTESVAMDINDSAQVVGGAQNSTGAMRPFLWLPSAAFGFHAGMNDLGTLGGENATIIHRAQAINSSGQVVGLSYTAGGRAQAFLWLPSAAFGLSAGMNNLGTLPGGDTSWAFGINNLGQVVGTSEVAGGDFHAFIWQNGSMIDLHDLIDPNSNWELIRAIDINDDGDIVGWGTNPAGETHAFVLIPRCGSPPPRRTAPFGRFLAAGDGTTNPGGVFEGTTVGDAGMVLAKILVVGANPGEAFEFNVTAPLPGGNGAPGPDLGTFAGLAGDVALDRALTLETFAGPGDFTLTVSMSFADDELATRRVGPEDVELHVLDPTQGSPPGVWMAAGANIGESPVTDIVGDSGFVAHSDGTVDFWAVRDAAGTFAVGAKTTQDEDEGSGRPTTPPRPPSLCGLGTVQAAFVGLGGLIVTHARRRRF